MNVDVEETNWATVENLKRLAKFRFMDDTFFMACFQDNKKGIQFLLRKILHQPELKVKRVNTQFLLKNLYGRDAYLDVYAEVQDGRYVNLEIQRSNAGAKPQRARYHASLMAYEDTGKRQRSKRSSRFYCDLHYRK